MEKHIKILIILLVYYTRKNGFIRISHHIEKRIGVGERWINIKIMDKLR